MGLVEAFGLEYSLQEIANLTAKAGSISAVRSLVDNFGAVSPETPESLALLKVDSFEKFKLVDLIAVVGTESKKNSSAEGQTVAASSVFAVPRLLQVEINFKEICELAESGNWSQIGEIIELEAIMLHSVMLTSKPRMSYLSPASFEICEAVVALREQGYNCYFTIDAGSNIHIILPEKDLEIVKSEIEKLESVQFTITNYPCEGTKLI
jgi:diphosphomevalonate decarboxylase